MEINMIRPVILVLISAMIAKVAHKMNGLDFSGALTTFLVLSVHFAASFRYGMMLMCFLLASFIMNTVGAEKRRQIYADYEEQGNWVHVLSHTAFATVLVVIIWWQTGGKDQCLDTNESTLITALLGGLIGHYSCCCADICSSMAILLPDNERTQLITTFRLVPKGTHGGVTMMGIAVSIIGGAAVGIAFLMFGFLAPICSSDDADVNQLLVVEVSGVAGLFGSLIDSLLGATLQFSGFCLVRKRVVRKPAPTVKRISGLNILGNDAVDFVSILLTTALSSYIFACNF